MKTKPVTVTLAYSPDAPALGNLEAAPYQIVKIHNEIAVPVMKKQARGTQSFIHVARHVGDHLTEWEASDLLTNPGTDVVTIPAKG